MVATQATEKPAAIGGFTKYPHVLFRQLTTRQAAVYLAARKFEGLPDGASISQMMALTGMKRTAVKDAVAALRASERIEGKRRGVRQTNLYIFPDGAPFTAVPNDLWRANLEPSQLMLWVSLAYFSTLEHGIFPSTRELAAMMRASKSTLAAATEALAALGLITVSEQGSERTGSGRNHYELPDIGRVLAGFSSANAVPRSSDLLVLNPAHGGTESGHQRYQIRPSLVPNPANGGTESGHTPEGTPEATPEAPSRSTAQKDWDPGSAGDGATTESQSQRDGQELAATGTDSVDTSGLESTTAEFLDTFTMAPHPGVADWDQVRRVEAAMRAHPRYVEILASRNGSVTASLTARNTFLAQCPEYRRAWDIAHGNGNAAAETSGDALSVPDRLAAVRDSDLSPEERRQRQKVVLADRLAKHP